MDGLGCDMGDFHLKPCQTFLTQRFPLGTSRLGVSLILHSLPIDPQTHRAIPGGKKHLLDTGLETVWGDSAKPVIIPPLPKR